MKENKIKKIFDFLEVSDTLKNTKRWGNTPQMVNKESSADHSWHLAMLVFLAIDELNLKVNKIKSLEMALIHDLVEALAGDTDNSLIAFGLKTKEEKRAAEIKAIDHFKSILPQKSGMKIYDFWQEYEEGKTEEAKLVKALDKIETINHMSAIGDSCFDHPELIAPYPDKAVNNCPDSKPLLKELKKRLKPKFESHGWEWKDEYDVKPNVEKI
ncbi:MAG: HD domain-containing protein [Patescibacteria group bacterium]